MGLKDSKADGIPQFILDRDRYAASNGLSAESNIRRGDDGELVILHNLGRPRSRVPANRTSEGVSSLRHGRGMESES
jgi:hypothetical protein